jgi:hypothetical protein
VFVSCYYPRLQYLTRPEPTRVELLLSPMIEVVDRDKRTSLLHCCFSYSGDRMVERYLILKLIFSVIFLMQFYPYCNIYNTKYTPKGFYENLLLSHPFLTTVSRLLELLSKCANIGPVWNQELLILLAAYEHYALHTCILLTCFLPAQ